VAVDEDGFDAAGAEVEPQQQRLDGRVQAVTRSRQGSPMEAVR
jgi:hypothetical protein